MSGSQLLVLRRGRIEWSKVDEHTGRTDIALTDLDRDEARGAARTRSGWSLASGADR